MSILTILFFGVLIGILIWFYFLNIPKTSAFLDKLPEPASSKPFLGVALDFASTKVVLTNITNYLDECGDLFKGRIGPFRLFLVVANYQFLEHILSSSKIIVKAHDYTFFKPWLGTGLLTSDGKKWKSHRRILTPAFHFQMLEQFIEIFEVYGNSLIKNLQKNLDKTSFDIYPYITAYTLDVICESIMGIKINAQIDDNSEYVKSVKNMCRIVIERAISPIQMFDLLYPFSKNYYTQKKALKILHKQSYCVIKTRREELENKAKDDNKTQTCKTKKMFLDLLLLTFIDGIPLTNEEIREEVDTFMFEGHDTTASAISFTLFCLATHQEVQKKAFQEQQRLFENRHDATTTTYNDLQNMKYLELVIKESLRLYPSVPFYGREITEDMKYENSFIPKGTTIVICAFKIQRDPRYFDNPHVFRPERFECVDGKLPYAYIPFSAGPRNCIGQKFAMLEMKCVLSKILRKFELKPAFPKHQPELVGESILKSNNGIKISLGLRN